jgi:hypothetical protein
MALRDRRLVNLIEFDKSALRVIVRRLLESADRYLQEYAVDELLASCRWLQLGVTLDVFPPEDATNLLVERFRILSNDLNERDSASNYLFDPRLYRLRRRSAADWQEFLGRDNSDAIAPIVTYRALFRSAMVTDISLVTDASAAVLLAYIAYAPEVLRQFALEAEPSSEGYALTPAVLRNGCAAAIGYIEQQEALFARFEADGAAAIDRTSDLYGHIRRIGTWKIRVADEVPRNALFAACNFALEKAGLWEPNVKQQLLDATAAWQRLNAPEVTTEANILRNDAPLLRRRLLAPPPTHELATYWAPFSNFGLWYFGMGLRPEREKLLVRAGSRAELEAFARGRRPQEDVEDATLGDGSSDFINWLGEISEWYRRRLQTNAGHPDLQNHFSFGSVLFSLALLNGDNSTLNEAALVLTNALMSAQSQRNTRQWVTAQLTLGAALWTSAVREGRNERLEQAVAAFLLAAEFASPELVWESAFAQQAAGDILFATWQRTQSSDALLRAIASFSAASNTLRSSHPTLEWALIQHKLGVALSDLGFQRGDPRTLSEAADVYRSALTAFTIESTPMYWAIAQHNLGTVLANLGQLQGSVRAFEASLDAFRAAYSAWPSDTEFNREARRAIEGLLAILRSRRGGI